MSGRKHRSDSTTEALRVVQGATKQIEPPSTVPLEAKDMPFFANVIEEFARADWTPHQLQLAAMLARTMSDLEVEQRTLRGEGYVITTENGKNYENPRVRSVRGLTGDLLAQRRSLSLHARARTGEARDTAKRRQNAKALEAETDLDDDLIARPN